MTTKLERARKQLEDAQNASVKAMRSGDEAALAVASDKAAKAFGVIANSHGGSRAGSGRKPSLTLYERADRRVSGSAQLTAYREFILADWPEGDEHWRWVITATVVEIVEWARAGQA